MKSIVRVLAVAASVVALGVNADEADDILASLDSASSASDEDGSDEGADEAEGGESGEVSGTAGSGNAIQIHAKTFYILPFCRRLEGRAEVSVPGTDGWQVIEEGKYYPLGSTYRTVGPESRLQIKFGPNATVSMKGEASFSTRAQNLEEKSRTIGLLSGTILVKLPSDLKEGMFVVTAPGFTVKNLAGVSRFTYAKNGDGDEATVRCVTQTMTVEGLHFIAPAMRASHEIRIRTSQDQLLTALYGKRGDVLVRLDQGDVQIKDYATGETKIEPKVLDWKLSPLTTVRIHRARPALGGLMSVSTMTFDERGKLRNRCAFTERVYAVNSGEIGPTTKKEREALAKRTAELVQAQDTSEAAAETSESEAEEEPSESEF